MDKKLWFKRKEYGWGWTPASKEGWITMIVFTLVLAFASIAYFQYMKRLNEVLDLSEGVVAFVYILLVSFLSLILILICTVKGEKPKWTWGNKAK
jgi:hypothetical protein